jgi:hypothetical protein
MENNSAQERVLQQDDYQFLMNFGHMPVHSDCSFLVGNREIDTSYVWPSSWRDFSFKFLVSWLATAKKNAVLSLDHARLDDIDISSFSVMQRKAYDIVYKHTFGCNCDEQLLMIVVGTAGTGKSFLINAIRQLFFHLNSSQCLKITAPTGIAASNIHGSTVYSLLLLMSERIDGERLLSIQITMVPVKLLVIDEYSFLNIANIDSLDRRLRVVFPQRSCVPFGGLNIILCGDPAQLPPIRTQPAYAYHGSTLHLAARFHLFTKVVELDHPFRQAGENPNQVRFRALLNRVADCEATVEDWKWLQTRTSACLSAEENELFDNNRHVVSTNDTRHWINRERLSKLLPVIKIDDQCQENVMNVEDDTYDADHYNTGDCQLFAVGAEVMLVMNLWTEAGLVNGACGNVVEILKPDNPGRSHVLLINFPGYRGPALSAEEPTVVPITQVSSKKVNSIPLTLSWAITIHKSQGMSMDRLTIDLGEKEYSSGLTFVALSRAKAFSGIRIRAFNFERYKQISAGRYVTARRSEFSRLRLLAARTE